MKAPLKSDKGRVGVEIRNNTIRLNLPRAWFDGAQRRFAVGLSDSHENRIRAEQIAKQIELDYLALTFDSTLEKYKVQSEDKPKLTIVRENKSLTLLELWTEYQNYKQPTRKETTQNTIECYGKLILKIKEVDCSDALRVRELLLSISTNHQVKRTLIELNAAFEWGIKHKLISSTQISPYAGMASELPRYNFQINPKPNAFSKDEMDQVIQSFRSHKASSGVYGYSFYAPFVEFLFLTGCRTSEAVSLRWFNISLDCSEVEFNGSLLYVKNRWVQTKGSKNNRSRIFPCSPRLIQLLTEIKTANTKDKQLVFPAPKGGPINKDNFAQRAWNTVVDPIKADTTPYSCRDTFITQQLLKGIPVLVIAKWVDSSVEMIEKVYADYIKLRAIRPID
jgi:integrase